MPVFATIRELGSGKKYETATNYNMSQNNSSETNPVISAHKVNTDSESETCILTQEKDQDLDCSLN